MGSSRSLIFIPGNNQRFLEKSKGINSDIICYDLEDSVPLGEKDVARKLIATKISELNSNNMEINNERIIAVRTNSPDSKQIPADLEKIVIKGIDAIVIPKVNEASQVSEISDLIDRLEAERNIPKGHLRIMPSIESALGVVNTFEIARCNERISSVVFGIFDFLHDMKIDSYYNDIQGSYVYGRSKVPVDARAAGVDSIDCIWQDINDTNGLINDLKLGKNYGYNGKCIIHPSQIDHVHRVFSPSKQEIEWAKKVVEALDNAQKNLATGAVKLEGKMIDAVHYKQAKRILESIKENTI
ncbi:HpcH/HpaI aldolase/citrate lyase family protein [Candidatus Nitrosocosmicus franklandus]|uniref:Citrate lyase subunit beta n=1 Tax=Candidatus Nitrosocosmicus franklandianus TaxID=1798806 RepID=A0A484I6L1_9ARCH|nr:CoA ester lyase [Candidatus Nitrosocosmicus franklandus]VFJ13348.1 Citrate lyase subunit beta [Candidatus Nitrosocosmicus franklandus]